MGTEVRSIINDMLSACVSNSAAEPIKLFEPTYKKGYFEIHNQPHVMFNAPPGFGKSSLIEQIPKKKRVETIDYSKAGILGSIKKTGEFVDGAVTRAAGKVWIVDEHHKVPDSVRGSITSLLENQKTSRSMGFSVMGEVKPIRKKLLRMTIKKGLIDIEKVRFSSLWLGIYQEKKRFDDRALASRFFPASFLLSWDDLKKACKGWNPISIKDNKNPGGHVFEDYEKFVDIYLDSVMIYSNKNKVQKSSFFMQNPEFPRRGILHFCRLFSWASGSNSVIDDWEKYIPYIPITIYNTIASTLTLVEYNVLSMLMCDMNQVEIANELSISKQRVSKVYQNLDRCGLVDLSTILQNV